MKALLVLSAVIAVVLSAPPIVRPGQYVPWQSNRYYNSYNSGRNVYSSPRWYQPTIRPLSYEASTLSPWQGKAKFSFGSAVASTPAAVLQPEAEQKTVVVESTPAVLKVPAGFGAFHFGKKSTPVVITKEEIKPIETLTPEIKITKTIIESSSGAEASLKSISSEKPSLVLESAKPALVETASVQSFSENNLSTGLLAKDSEQSQLIISSQIKSEQSLNKLDVKESSDKSNKTSLAIEQSNTESAEKPLIEDKPLLVDEIKISPIVETQTVSEIKSEIITPVGPKKKHGFSFSYNPSSNIYNKNIIQLNPSAQLPAATVPEIKPQTIVIQAVQPSEDLQTTLQSEIVNSEKETDAPASLTTETLQYTTETIASTNEYVVPTLDINQPIIQYQQSVSSEAYAVNQNAPSLENKPAILEDVPSTIEYAVPTLDISQPIIQYGYSVPSEVYAENLNAPSEEIKPATLEDVPATSEYVVPTADISQPIIQYALPSEKDTPTTIEPTLTTTESSPVSSDYANEYSPINSESIVETIDSLVSDAATTENVPVTTEAVIYLQTDFEPALTNVQAQPENVEVVAIESSAPLLSEPLAIQYNSAVSSQSSYSVTPAAVKKNLGFSFSYNPSGYIYNKEASLTYKPISEAAVSEIKITPAVTTLSPSTTQNLQPVVSTVIPAANIWSNFYNANKNTYSFSYNPAFNYFNRQPFYQPQVAVPSPATILPVPSIASIVSSPAASQSSSSFIEISPVNIESAPATPEPVKFTTVDLENFSEDAQSITTESFLSEVTTLSTEYGTAESEEKKSFGIVNKPAPYPHLALIDSSASALSVPVVLVESSSSLAGSSAGAIQSSSSSAEIVQIATESTSLEPELSESTTVLNEIATDNAESKLSTTESYSDESTTFVIGSSESFSTTQKVPASVDSISAAIETSIKKALNGQLVIASISKEAAPVAIKTESIAQTSSVIQTSPGSLESFSNSAAVSPVLIQSAPSAAASTQAIAVPLYVKQESKASSPAALPAFQPTFVTKKHGFSFSYKPSGNYYSKPVVIAAAAPAIVESSPIIASAAPAIVESAPVIVSAAPAIVESSSVIASAIPAIVESSPVISSAAPAIVESSSAIASVAPTESSLKVSTSQSIFLSIFNAVKSAILDEKVTEVSTSAKPEVALVAEPKQLNSEAVVSQYDISVKASPVNSDIKEDANIIHDLRLGY